SSFLAVLLDRYSIYDTWRIATLDDVPDDHPDFALAARAGVRLGRLAPAAVEQDAGGLHARGGWHGLLADDPGEHPDAKLGVPPRQRPQIGRYSLSGHWLTGWA